MSRERKQKYVIGLAAVALAIAVWSIPTLLFLRDGRQILPLIDVQIKKPPPPLPQMPFEITINPDNNVSAGAANELDEEQKEFIKNGLQVLFHAHTNNLSYYFKYFTIVEFGSDEETSAFVVVFSSEPPQVGVENGVKKVNWTGQRINFDIIKRHMIFVIDGDFTFIGTEKLKVRTFYSASLELKQSQPQPSPNQPKPSPSEKF